MIKLIRLIPKHIREAADLPPPTVSFVQKADQHAYAKAAGDHAGKQYFQGNVDFSAGNADNDIVTKAAKIIKAFENNPNLRSGGFDKAKKKWFPHRSLEGGTPTIAYGHKMKPGENFSAGITDSEAEALLQKDIRNKLTELKKRIKSFDALPMTIKIAAVNAAFRGDLGPKTMDLLAKNQFAQAAKEYLNHNEYRTTSNSGVKKRMEWNAKVFAGSA
jgi:GH24 family phage-related lysozyme (muramidase)